MKLQFLYALAAVQIFSVVIFLLLLLVVVCFLLVLGMFSALQWLDKDCSCSSADRPQTCLISEENKQG